MIDGHLVIDADAHVMEPWDLWLQYIDPEFRDRAPRGEPGQATGLTVNGKTMGRAREAVSDGYVEWMKQLIDSTHDREKASGWSAQTQLEVMDEEGIDAAVLYPSRGLYALAVEDIDGPLAGAIARAYNRWIRDFCSADAQRLVGIGLVSLHDPAVAVREVRFAAEELGLRGVMIRPNPIAGRPMHHPSYAQFWSTCAELQLPVSIHEGLGVYMAEHGPDRFAEHILWHLVSHPFEQMESLASLIVGGVLERNPTLRIAVLESGGTWAPFWLGRMDEHCEWLRPVSMARHLSLSPTEYFRRQCWISAEPDEPTFAATVDYLGADHVMWASDYPHPDATFPGALREIRELDSISDETRRQILQDAPATLYDLDLAALRARRAAAAPATSAR